jgi:putative membrane protein
MKNYKQKLVSAAVVIIAVAGLSSCMDNNPKDTKIVAEEKNEKYVENHSFEQDAQFLVSAHEINLEVISLGKLAQQKGNTSHVRDLGKMMESEHLKSLADLTTLAKSKNISIPTSDTKSVQETYEKLNKKIGSDFGKEYSSMMVSSHKNAIILFDKASIECTDPEIKAWALATIPTLRKHLDLSLECQKKCEENKR